MKKVAAHNPMKKVAAHNPLFAAQNSMKEVVVVDEMQHLFVPEYRKKDMPSLKK